jgi:8-oxo-dGTP diphosphatase
LEGHLNNLSNKIRTSAKAAIIHNNSLLTIQKLDKDGSWYVLPGGGQHYGETLYETLKRECIEEVNAEIQIGELKFIREYISCNHEFANTEPDCHQMEFIFLCTALDYEAIRFGSIPDEGQVSIKWIEIDRLLEYRVYPLSTRQIIMNISNYRSPVYLGDIN